MAYSQPNYTIKLFLIVKELFYEITKWREVACVIYKTSVRYFICITLLHNSKCPFVPKDEGACYSV